MVSVVIPVYNGDATIEACIGHVETQSLLPFEIIVIDDCSTDSTSDKLTMLSKRYTNITVLKNEENLGKAVSVEDALKLVGSPLTAIVDADTYLERDYLRNAVSSLANERTVAVSGIVLPSGVDNGVAKSRLIEYLYGQSTYKRLHERLGVSLVSPGCCSVWRTDWIRGNGIPTDTVVEDMELTWEAQMDGKKVVYNPDALAYTEEPSTFNGYVRQVNRWFSWRPVLEKNWQGLTDGLRLLITWMLAESVGYILWIGLTFYFMASGKLFLAIFMLLGDVFVVTLVSVHKGLRMGYSLSKIVTSIPYYYALRIPTVIMFWKSLIAPKRSGW
jgi:cellulose synthase/poly-beta-1,6-N-acetylglucosamine synthase-like glycosyltransferase